MCVWPVLFLKLVASVKPPLAIQATRQLLWHSQTLYQTTIAGRGSGDMAVPNLFWRNADVTLVTSYLPPNPSEKLS